MSCSWKIPSWVIAQRQSLPLNLKLRMSFRRIRDWYEHWDGDVHVAFSGGKDSTVLLHLVRSLYPEVRAVFVDTGLEYPEIKQFVKSFDNVEIIRPEKTFRQVVEQEGWPVVGKRVAQYIRQVRATSSPRLISLRLHGEYAKDGTKSPLCKIPNKWQHLITAPFKISEKCCDVMKKRPMAQYEKRTGSKPYIGTMAADSRNRLGQYRTQGCNAFDNKRPTSNPLSFWMHQDILEYAYSFLDRLAPVYGDIVRENGKYRLTGVRNTGCLFCAFGVTQEARPNRFEQLKETHPKLWQYIMYEMGLAKVLDELQVEYGV